jgi:hypothetical protein
VYRAAWNGLGDMPASEAKAKYIATVTSVAPDWDIGNKSGSSSGAQGSEAAGPSGQGSALPSIRHRGSAATGGLGGPVFSTFAQPEDGHFGGSTEEGGQQYPLGSTMESTGQTSSSGGRGGGQGASGAAGTLLHELAGKGDVERLMSLLEGGADVEARDDQGCTALHFAADRGQVRSGW